MPTATLPSRYRYNGGHWMTLQPVLTPIPGNDLRVGDRLWCSPNQVMTVERITIAFSPKISSVLVAHGQKTLQDRDLTLPGCEHPFIGDDWVVVER